MKPTTALLALAFCVAAFAAPRAEAQFSLIPYAGYNLDAEAALVGIGAEFAAPFSAGSLELGIRPSIEVVFVDGDGSYYQANGDVIARFSGSPSLAPYAGVGLGVVIFDSGIDGVDTATDLGLNILGGVEFPGVLAFGTPFAQGRITLADGSAVAIMGGLSIPLGQR